MIRRTTTVGDRDAPLFAPDADWDDAQATLLDLALSDGLPAVVPTEARLAAMLQGRDPDASFDFMPPLFGEITNASVAWCCVIAGCRPDECPVVMTAALACLDPGFNLLGIQTTTGTPTAAALVHGPIAADLGMNAGTNCLGPGNRANACIGRALRLVLTNIGGARPLIGDMATMGQPAKYGMAFAEGTHPIIPPFHSRRGLETSQSAVTVIGLSGTIEVLPEAGAETPEALLRPALAAMRGGRDAGSAGRDREPGEQFLLLPPEMADVLAKSGWDLTRARDFLWSGAGTDRGQERPVARTPSDIHIILTGGAGVKMTCLVPWGGGTMCVTRPVD
jgi:hypothetical protein